MAFQFRMLKEIKMQATTLIFIVKLLQMQVMAVLLNLKEMLQHGMHAQLMDADQQKEKKRPQKKRKKNVLHFIKWTGDHL